MLLVNKLHFFRHSSLTNSLSSNGLTAPIEFGYDSVNDVYGYIKAGADTVTPFSNSQLYGVQKSSIQSFAGTSNVQTLALNIVPSVKGRYIVMTYGLIYVYLASYTQSIKKNNIPVAASALTIGPSIGNAVSVYVQYVQLDLLPTDTISFVTSHSTPISSSGNQTTSMKQIALFRIG